MVSGKDFPSSKEPLQKDCSWIDLDKISTYNVSGRTFIVEPVFSKTSVDTIDKILVRLMRGDCIKR